MAASMYQGKKEEIRRVQQERADGGAEHVNEGKGPPEKIFKVINVLMSEEAKSIRGDSHKGIPGTTQNSDGSIHLQPKASGKPH
jgi:hypothetical protein